MDEPGTKLRRVCVYCASSQRAHADYQEAARRLGALFAGEALTICYGGGATGSMGALAEGALAAGGTVVGVVPRFMQELEWTHTGLSELHVVADMHERKRLMLRGADAAVALPGGSGTFDELLEVISLKRLGEFLGPIVLVNTRGYFDRLVQLLEFAVAERFMDERHLAMWQLAETPEQALDVLRRPPAWSQSAVGYAVLK